MTSPTHFPYFAAAGAHSVKSKGYLNEYKQFDYRTGDENQDHITSAMKRRS